MHHNKSYNEPYDLGFVNEERYAFAMSMYNFVLSKFLRGTLSVYFQQYPEHHKYIYFSNEKGSNGQVYIALH